jgi:hypothetical protein
MVKISVYIDTGNVYEYEVGNEATAREHADAIIKTGYRSVQTDALTTLTWWPPHRISKVKVALEGPSATAYTDTPRAT